MKGIFLKTRALLLMTLFLQYFSTKVQAVESFLYSGSYYIEKTSVQETFNEYEEIQSTINEISSKYGATGVSVAIIENGIATDAWQYGYAVDGTAKMETDTKIRIASITKVLLAMNAFKLKEQGILDIDTDIGVYGVLSAVDRGDPEKEITLRSIFTHTSLIPDVDISILEEKFRTGEIVIPAKSSTTSGWSYCNAAFGIAGITIEKAAGKSIFDISTENFFEPMGIDAAFASGRIQDKSLIASLYQADGKITRSREEMSFYIGSDTPGNNAEYMAGGVCISAIDLARVISILANDGIYNGRRYLSEQSVMTMETGYCSADLHGKDIIQCVPLMYKADIYGQDGLYFHTGSAYGVYALASYNPETRNGVVVLTTGASGACDGYGIYAVCGEIADYLYTQ